MFGVRRLLRVPYVHMHILRRMIILLYDITYYIISYDTILLWLRVTYLIVIGKYVQTYCYYMHTCISIQNTLTLSVRMRHARRAVKLKFEHNALVPRTYYERVVKSFQPRRSCRDRLSISQTHDNEPRVETRSYTHTIYIYTKYECTTWDRSTEDSGT